MAGELPDFVQSRERMHDDHLLLGARHEMWRHDVVTAGVLVLLLAAETLLLDARHVQNIRVRQNLLQVTVISLKGKETCVNL